MRKLISAICVILVMTVLCACASASLSFGDSLCADVKQDASATYGYVKMETAAPVSYNEYKLSAIDFSFKALSALYDGDEPVLFSPAALFSTLSLLENAATGSTQAQIKKAAAPDIGLSGLNESSGYFLSRLGSIASGDNKITLSGSMFFNEGNAVSGELLKTNVNYYNQGLFRLKYSDTDTLNRINNYLSEQSLGGCEGLFEKLDKDMNLASTAVMSDTWLSKLGQSGEYLTGTEYLIEGKKCKGFIKDFKDTPARFVAIMPENGIEKFLASFSNEEFTKLVGSMSVFKTADINIKPIKAEANIDFSDALKSMGIGEVFTSGKFGGISFGKKAAAGSIRQYACVSIDANGANSKQKAKSESSKAKAQTTLSFDRPYVYMIIDNESNIPVFMGIENPKK